MSGEPRRRITMKQFNKRLLDVEVKIIGLEALMQSLLDQANKLQCECDWLTKDAVARLQPKGTE